MENKTIEGNLTSLFETQNLGNNTNLEQDISISDILLIIKIVIATIGKCQINKLDFCRILSVTLGCFNLTLAEKYVKFFLQKLIELATGLHCNCQHKTLIKRLPVMMAPIV